MTLYCFVKLSGSWYGEVLSDSDELQECIEPHVENGNIVCISDDIGTFANEMNINPSEIVMG